MHSNDDEALTVLGLDPHDPASVVAWRNFLLDWDADLAVMAAAVAAKQVRVRAKLEEMASALDAVDGTVEHTMHVQSVAAEVALIEQIGHSAAEGALSDAGIAVREFPGFVDALSVGRVSEQQLRVLTGAGLSVSHVDPTEQSARRGEFVRVMLAELDSRALPPKALQIAAARVAESLTEESVSQRHQRARRTRHVSVTAAENGMCMLRARLPLIEGKAIADRLRKQGKALIKARPKPGNSGEGVQEAPDERTIDEVKADLLADMLLTSDPMSCAAAAGIQASVQLTIPILTALTKLNDLSNALDADAPKGSGAGSGSGAACDRAGAESAGIDAGTGSDSGSDSEARADTGVGVGVGVGIGIGIGSSRAAGASRLTPAPALLDGMIPIPLEEALRLAGTATPFVRVLTHPITGSVAAVDCYRPTAAMRAFLTARDIHCRWPGCRQPAARCDLDHTHAWEHGGTTTLENLCGLCRHHHVMKHSTAWSVEQLGGGILDWRTPSGKICTDRPEHHDVYFTPHDEYPRPRGREQCPTGASYSRPSSEAPGEPASEPPGEPASEPPGEPGLQCSAASDPPEQSSAPPPF